MIAALWAWLVRLWRRGAKPADEPTEDDEDFQAW